jgi:LuxR family transcriptional regulator, positive regulator of biofilm formation
MDAPTHPTRQTVEPADDVIIEIVGANTFNGDLLAGYLQQESGVRCLSSQDSRQQAISEQSPPGTRLILFDCTDMNWLAIEPWIASMAASDDAVGLAVCFNVAPDTHIEQDALRLGVRGVLYKEAPTDIYPKAVHAILNGELWYTRKALQRYIEAPIQPGEGVNSEAVLKLTQRERTILGMIAKGGSNKKIAEELCISPHTVKTHIYNLFRKINVANRFQAALWLSRNQ